MKTIAIGSVMGLLLYIGGCGVPRQPAAAQTVLLLTDNPDTQPSVALSECLRVRTVRAAAPFTGAALLYRTGERTYEKDYYNGFAAAPDKQVNTLLAARLNAAGVTICPDGIRGDRRLTLEPHLEALYADLTAPTAPFAVAKMRFVLTAYDGSCRCGSIVFDRTFEATASLPAKPTAEAVVAAMSAAVGDVLEQGVEQIGK